MQDFHWGNDRGTDLLAARGQCQKHLASIVGPGWGVDSNRALLRRGPVDYFEFSIFTSIIVAPEKNLTL